MAIEEKIEGQQVVFDVTNTGLFETVYGDHRYQAPTLTECRNKVRAAIRRSLIKLEIKAHVVNMFPESEEFKPWYERKKVPKNVVRAIVIRGFDARSYEPLVEFADGRRSKVSRRDWRDGHGDVVRQLSEKEVAEYQRLVDAKYKANSEFDQWMENHQIKDLEAYIKAEIEKRLDEQKEPTGDPRIDPGVRKRRTK